MALILNASEKAQHVTVFGNHFVLKAGQVKNFQDNIAGFLSVDRADMGFVALPEEFMDPSYGATPEGKEIFEKARAQGVAARIRHLKQIVYNLQVSLRQDLDKNNIKADARTFASDGEIDAMEELLSYQKAEEDETKKKVDRIKEIESKLTKASK